MRKQGNYYRDVAIAADDHTRCEIQRFRYEVFYEECRRDVAGIDHANRTIGHPSDAGAFLLYVRKQGRIVGTVRVDLGDSPSAPPLADDWFGLAEFADYPRSALCFAGQLMVAAERRSSTVTLNLISACYQLAREHGVRFAFCGASPGLVKLYEHMGFRRYRDNITVHGHGYQVPMVCMTEDVEYLSLIRSPFARLAAQWPNGTETGTWFAERFPRMVGYEAEHLLDSDALDRYFSQRLGECQSGLLDGLDNGGRRALLASGTVLRCLAGDEIMGRGRKGNELFLLADGCVGVCEGTESAAAAGTERKRGETFGEAALYSEGPRGATAVARTDCEVIVFTRAAIQRALSAMPATQAKLLANLGRILSLRLRESRPDQVADKPVSSAA